MQVIYFPKDVNNRCCWLEQVQQYIVYNFVEVPCLNSIIFVFNVGIVITHHNI